MKYKKVFVGKHINETMISSMQKNFSEKVKILFIVLISLILVEPFVILWLLSSDVIFTSGTGEEILKEYAFLKTTLFSTGLILFILLTLNSIRFTWITDKGFKINIYQIRNATAREMLEIFQICEKNLECKTYIDELSKDGRKPTNIDFIYIKKCQKLHRVK